MAQKRFTEALAIFDTAIVVEPHNSTAWSNKARTLLNLPGRTADAFAAAEEAVRLNPRNVIAWNAKGNALREI